MLGWSVVRLWAASYIFERIARITAWLCTTPYYIVTRTISTGQWRAQQSESDKLFVVVARASVNWITSSDHVHAINPAILSRVGSPCSQESIPDGGRRTASRYVDHDGRGTRATRDRRVAADRSALWSQTAASRSAHTASSRIFSRCRTYDGRQPAGRPTWQRPLDPLLDPLGTRAVVPRSVLASIPEVVRFFARMHGQLGNAVLQLTTAFHYPYKPNVNDW